MVEDRKLEYDHHPTPKQRREGKPSQIILCPYSNLLEPIVNLRLYQYLHLCLNFLEFTVIIRSLAVLELQSSGAEAAVSGAGSRVQLWRILGRLQNPQGVYVYIYIHTCIFLYIYIHIHTGSKKHAMHEFWNQSLHIGNMDPLGKLARTACSRFV